MARSQISVQPRVGMDAQLPRMQRHIRRPSHNWAVKNPPFCFQPCMVAPVLPGETLKSARWQARAITQPILGRLLGWWLEHYLFYVPISAMQEQVGTSYDLKGMFTGYAGTPVAAMPTIAQNSTRSDVNYMIDDGSVTSFDWLGEAAIPAIIRRFFRSDTVDANPEDNYYFANTPPGNDRWYKVKAEAPGWMDSFRATATDDLTDIDLLGDASDATLMISEVDTALRQWELLRMNGLTQQTYEEFLMTYRVSVPVEPGVGTVELLRYSRAWQYPSNTVVPTTGAVTSAVSWSVSESADKDRFFREPGLIVMGTCARPKVYYSKQTSYAASQMTDAFAWLPATLWDQSRVGERKLVTDQLIKDIGASTFDVKDLLMYGDQFLNDLAITEFNMVGLPVGSDWNSDYPIDADIKALFVTAATDYFVLQDGHCELSIATSVTDPMPMKAGS